MLGQHIAKSVSGALPGPIGLGLDIGGIGVFDADPGTDYVAPDGRILKASDYPDIGKVLPLSAGLGLITPPRALNVLGNALDAGGLGVIVASDSTAVVTSQDGGETFASVTIPALGGAAYGVACDPTGQFQIVYTASVNSNTTAAGSISSDTGRTFSRGAVSVDGYPAIYAAWLGGAFAAFAIGVNVTGGSNFHRVKPNGDRDYISMQNTSGALISADINPSTNVILLSMSDIPTRIVRFVGFAGSGVGVGGTIPFNGSSRNVWKIKYANGLWLVATANGLFRSTDDGVSFNIVPNTEGFSFYDVMFAQGKWLAFGGNNARSVYVLTADATAISLFSDFLPSGTGYYTNTKISASSKYILTVVSASPAKIGRSASLDIASQFAVAPNVPSTGLILPKKYYMRAK